LKDFHRIHYEADQRLNGYLEQAKSNYQRLSEPAEAMLQRRSDMYLHAVNARSRVMFAAAAVNEMKALRDGKKLPGPIFLVTFTPDIFARSESESAQFDPRTLQDWVTRILVDNNFVGMVEAAFYPFWPHGTKEATISWHAHLLVWGVSYRQLDRKLAPIRNAYGTLVPGVFSAHTQKVSDEQVESKLLYILKMPLNQYQPYPVKQERLNRDTGELIKTATGRFKQKKPPLRTGQLVRMVRVMQNQFLDALLFANGEGVATRERIVERALRRYHALEPVK
jgi:hypothetical protein